MSQFRNSCLLSSLWSSEDSCTGCWDCTWEVYKECGWKTRALMILERFRESGFGVWRKWVKCCSKRIYLFCCVWQRVVVWFGDRHMIILNQSSQLWMKTKLFPMSCVRRLKIQARTGFGWSPSPALKVWIWFIKFTGKNTNTSSEHILYSPHTHTHSLSMTLEPHIHRW